MSQQPIRKKPVSDFLACYRNSKTRRNYQTTLHHFLPFVSPKELLKKNTGLNGLARHYLRELSRNERDVVYDLRQFSLLLNKKYAPTTVHLYLRNTIVWLEDNGYRITRRERNRISAQLPPPYPRIEDIELKRKTFRALYHALPDDIGTLFLFQLASGMRIGETLKLKRTDVDWTQKRTAIIIPSEITKTKTPRVTYLTEEASAHLISYLEDRTDSDEALFLISYQRARKVLHDVSLEMGYTQRSLGKVYGFHWHMTRKWFLSRFSLAASRDIAEHLAGHEGYLSRSYRRYTKKQILKHYIKAEKKLSILKEREKLQNYCGTKVTRRVAVRTEEPQMDLAGFEPAASTLRT